jgi:hypothetical protein
MTVEDKKPVDVKRTLELIAERVQPIEDHPKSEELKVLAVAVSCLAAIVDGHEDRLRRLESAVSDLVGRGRL